MSRASSLPRITVASARKILTRETRAGFDTPDEVPPARFIRAALKPVSLMLESHRRILAQLQERGRKTGQSKLRLTASDRLLLVGGIMGAA
ncbi:hypothetical protein [Microvirga sp. 2TAF3]|uniref:hypothetical protein n=1 Tax=Microvirga sp. 2TAF3 TaxID=3233014 RepID=UPI003F9481A1